jgi:anthranilate phosphoribosyltransferase
MVTSTKGAAIMFRENLSNIIQGNDLSETQMSQMITEIFSKKITDAQIGAFMAALATKGETFEELAGAARAMRRKALRIQASAATIVDTCGTGGDGAQTFNISTTTAFVVAGCGVTVAKHGNRSVSSQCGSADLLETLGVKLDTAPEIVEEAVHEIGIGFLFAPIYHSAMRYAAKARKEIGLRSIFNMLGPLTNPAGANCQLLGVYAPELTEMFAHALQRLGTKRAFVVHGHDGLDEISVCMPTRISELKDGLVHTYDISPEQFFGERADPAELLGGNPEENASITRKILQGEKGPKRNVVLLNAAAALVAADQADDFQQGIQMAKIAIDEGSSAEKMESLIRFTQENG